MRWPMVQLGAVLTERREVPDITMLTLGKIRIVAKIGFNDGKIHFRANGETKTGMILVRPGDLLVSGINAAKGAIAIYGEDNEMPAAATIHYGAYMPNKARVDPTFLWWLLRSDVFREILLENVPGGIKTELKAKRLLPVPVSLPSLTEQWRIVARIEQLVAKIEEAMDMRSISQRESEISMEAFLNHVIGTLDHSGFFSDVITFNPRSGPSFVTNPNTEGIPVLMPSAVTGFGVNPQKVEYGIEPVTISEKDRLSEGDIVIARGNKRDQVGNAGIVPAECAGWVCANLLMRIQVDHTLADNHFCIYWLRSPKMREHIRARMSGTNPNILKINQQKILAFPFPTSTPLDKQRRIVEYLNDLQAKIDSLKRLQSHTATELDALLPSVLDKAFKGEL